MWCLTKRGIPFADFHKSISKVQHALKGIPVVKTLFTVFNQLIAVEPKVVFIWKTSELSKSISGF